MPIKVVQSVNTINNTDQVHVAVWINSSRMMMGGVSIVTLRGVVVIILVLQWLGNQYVHHVIQVRQ